MNLSDFLSAIQQEIGQPLYEWIGDRPFQRWINAGQRKLGSYRQRTANVVWAAGDTSIPLPSDFHHVDEFVPAFGSVTFPPGRAWDGQYRFNSPALFAGNGELRYYGVRPDITDNVPSTLDKDGNEALVSYSLYRLFKRLSSSRADYRMYATITQSNGVDIAELDAIGERHLQDFKDAQESLEPLEASSYYDED